MERKPQTLANHAKLDPPFHFVLLPVMLVMLILTIVHLVRHYDNLTPWILFLMAIAIVLAATRARVYPLKVQDRVIRLEERMRLERICGDPLRSKIGGLTESQLVALRFASDGEVPGLADKALSQSLSNKDIKKAVVNWRPDYFRV